MNDFGRLSACMLFGATLLSLVLCLPAAAQTKDNDSDEYSETHAQFETLRPNTIAVLPMDNFSLEPAVEDTLHQEVYARLAHKGYAKVSAEHVSEVMARLGVTVPGLLAGFSPTRLGQELNADALLMGQIEQSSRINQLAYDAVVVSCSLRLIDAKTGATLWRAEQWRTAHRQWQVDPINIFLNALAHGNDPREKRIAYLVQQMLKTLPPGPVTVEQGDLLKKATVIKATEKR